MYLSILLMGILMGFRHALEADHVLAVLAVSANSNRSQAIMHGVVWGVGHSITLLLVGVIVLSADTLIPHGAADFLELSVGVMLLILGIDVFRRARKNHFHIHVHKHATGINHIHWHAHERQHDSKHERHDHVHLNEIPLRSLLVGIVHGLSGSAALILLALQTVQSTLLGIIYIALFGFGSIAGMAILSAAAAVPAGALGKRKSWQRLMNTAVGGVTMIFGAVIVLDHLAVFL